MSQIFTSLYPWPSINTSSKWEGGQFCCEGDKCAFNQTLLIWCGATAWKHSSFCLAFLKVCIDAALPIVMKYQADWWQQQWPLWRAIGVWKSGSCWKCKEYPMMMDVAVRS